MKTIAAILAVALLFDSVFGATIQQTSLKPTPVPISGNPLASLSSVLTSAAQNPTAALGSTVPITSTVLGGVSPITSALSGATNVTGSIGGIVPVAIGAAGSITGFAPAIGSAVSGPLGTLNEHLRYNITNMILSPLEVLTVVTNPLTLACGPCQTCMVVAKQGVESPIANGVVLLGCTVAYPIIGTIVCRIAMSVMKFYLENTTPKVACQRILLCKGNGMKTMIDRSYFSRKEREMAEVLFTSEHVDAPEAAKKFMRSFASDFGNISNWVEEHAPQVEATVEEAVNKFGAALDIAVKHETGMSLQELIDKMENSVEPTVGEVQHAEKTQ